MNTSKNIFRLSNIVRLFGALIIILFLSFVIVSSILVNQVMQERRDMRNISNSIMSQGISTEFKNLTQQYISKYPNTVNIIVTDNDNKIVYKANNLIIENKEIFEMEGLPPNVGLKRMKGTRTIFITNPRLDMPIIFRPPWEERNKFIERGPGRDNWIMKDDLWVRGPDNLVKHHANGKYFINGFKIDDKSQNLYFISKEFKETNFVKLKFIISALLRLAALIFWLLLAYWVYKDSKSRGLNSIFWGVLTLLTGIIGWLIYVIHKHNILFCHICEKKNKSDANYCSNCGASIRNKCNSCQSMINKKDNYCSICGAERENEN